MTTPEPQRQPVRDDRLRVACIAGTGRSGSTLLAGLLGQYAGAENLGEVRFLWSRGLTQQRRCGCGRAVPDCPLWQDVWGRVQRSTGPVDAERFARRLDQQLRLRHVTTLPSVRRPVAATPELRDTLEVVGSTYRAAAASSGARVLVDASKLPAWVRMVEAIPSLDVTIVHLVRHPAAVAGSWARHKADVDGPGALERRSPLKSAGLWTAWNGLATAWWHDREQQVRVRLEDLLAEPARVLVSLAQLLGLDPAGAPLVAPSTASLAPTHAVSGNPDRFRTGEVELRPPTPPSPTGSVVHDLSLRATTGWLARRYGYRAVRRAPAPSHAP